jgi:hypothetical protein
MIKHSTSEHFENLNLQIAICKVDGFKLLGRTCQSILMLMQRRSQNDSYEKWAYFISNCVVCSPYFPALRDYLQSKMETQLPVNNKI